MAYIILTFLAAFGVEGIGTYVSVMGLAATFAASPVILTLAVMLDIGKLIIVSIVYKYWKEMPGLMKLYFLPAAIVLMLITSYGAAGFLSKEFQGAMLPSVQNKVVLENYQKEIIKLEERKKEIDSQISNLPANYVTARKRLQEQFGPEINQINERITELRVKIPELEVEIADIEAHIGPVAFIADTFKITKQEAVSVIIAMIIFVFDPLAVMLIIAGNFLVDRRARINTQEKKEKVKNFKDELKELEAQKEILIGQSKLIEDELLVAQKEIEIAKAETETVQALADITTEVSEILEHVEDIVDCDEHEEVPEQIEESVNDSIDYLHEMQQGNSGAFEKDEEVAETTQESEDNSLRDDSNSDIISENSDLNEPHPSIESIDDVKHIVANEVNEHPDADYKIEPKDFVR